MTVGALLWLVARGIGLAILGVLCILLIPVHWFFDRGASGMTWLADRIVLFVAWVIVGVEDWKRDARVVETGR